MAVNGGVKNWVSGQVLDAADLNEFIADQTIARFETIAARTAAYGVSGAPSLQTGLFSWVESTEKLYFYDGSAWVEVGAQIEDNEVTTAKILDGAVTSAKILDGTIVNADVNASAAIAHSKLATITAGSVLMGNASNVPTATALSGDVTVNSSGVTAIASGVIVNADINSSAAIELNKLADVTIDRKTSGYTLASTDKNKIIEMDVGTAHQLAVPLNSTAPLPVGTEITIIQQGAGKTQIAGAVGVTLRSTPGLYLRAQYSSATLIKRATDEWYVIGDLSAT